MIAQLSTGVKIRLTGRFWSEVEKSYLFRNAINGADVIVSLIFSNYAHVILKYCNLSKNGAQDMKYISPRYH